MTEQRNHWRGIASSPLVLTLDRPQQAQVDTGYDVEVAPMQLRRQQTTTTPSVRQPRQTVTRPQHADVTVSVYPAPILGASTKGLPRSRSHAPILRLHWLSSMGIGMLAVLLVWLTGMALANWWQGVQDGGRAGQPPTFQCDAQVGHNDTHTPSHFVVVILNTRVEVVEFPGGDTAKVLVYHGPILMGQTPMHDRATVSFKDVNRDGKLDLLLTVGPVKYVFLNDNGAFRPLRADDHVDM